MSYAFARGQAGFSFPARLAEVLGLPEPMFGQLAFELLEVFARFITQHEEAAQTQRENLEGQRINALASGLVVITGVASSAAAKAGITRSAQGASTVNRVSNQMTVRNPPGP